MSSFEHAYAVVVGVANYATHALAPLPQAVLNDAVDVACTLWNPELCGYRADRVRLLLDEQATAAGIRAGLEWLSEHASEQDTALFFFSGHGWQREGHSYLAAHDARCEMPLTGMLSDDDLTSYLQAIRAGRLVVLLDSCFSGGALEVKSAGREGLPYGSRRGLNEEAYEKLGRGSGRILLASSSPREESIVSSDERNSLFTSFLLRGLRGEATVTDSETIGIFDLTSFVSREVSEQSLRRQNPVSKGWMRDNFPVALRRTAPAAPSHAPSSPQHPSSRIGSFVDAKNVGSIHTAPVYEPKYNFHGK